MDGGPSRRRSKFNRFMWATQSKQERGRPVGASAVLRGFALSALDLSLSTCKMGLTASAGEGAGDGETLIP